MSDIRFNNWKHQSGTGGVVQDAAGKVGIGSTQPTSMLDVGGDGKFTGVVTATSFSGSGANLTGIDASAIKFGGAVKAQANNSGVVITGVATATKFVGDGSELTGVSGFATALSSDTASILNKVFKTPVNLEVAADTTIQSDAASDNIAFMREGRVHVQSGVVLTVGSGTTVLTNVLGVFP